jgi:hypothetical protein
MSPEKLRLRLSEEEARKLIEAQIDGGVVSCGGRPKFQCPILASR